MKEKLKVIKRTESCIFNFGNATIDVIKVGNNGRYHKIILKLGAIMISKNLAVKLINEIDNSLSHYDVKVAANIDKNSLIVEYFYSNDAEFATLDARVIDSEEGIKVYFENIINIIVED